MPHREIQPNDVKNLLDNNENLSLIDVREEEEVAEGKIPGAKHIPLGEIHERLDEIDENTEHIMVCRSGGRSGKATDYLMTKGYKVKNMPGGMLEWEGPIEKK
ncbi:rhodanese-like domain-containing protein [Filobacillus milosensis]|uniref:Rhodanese-like domain-containing protein n=1 Tax=Filobacillus milosensis TaxID=94137 RepID=A0A4Y8IHQ8_9BACI|nr:rhodanese-like domain-containing protein [Filobacillus milosensis]TFB15093.1 rhodanese-like domain-containing protein [Filobacillus milosensis]